MTKIVYDTIIIGGGPAGLTAALYAARAGMRIIVLEGASSVSQATNTDWIENYPGFPEGINGYDLIEKIKKQVAQLGVEIIAADALSLKRGIADNADCWEIGVESELLVARSVIAATGTSWRRLNVEGEEAFIGRGVSFCATCDGPLYRGKKVVVVGGGDAALQEAIFLSNLVERVVLVHRRDRLRAAEILQQRALSNAKIEFVWNAVISKINGEKTVKSVIIKDINTGAEREVPTDGVFVFIGVIPNTALFKGIVELSAAGAIVVDGDMRTSTEGIFACGDCVEKTLRQIITACGDGAIAAHQAQLFVEAQKGAQYPPR